MKKLINRQEAIAKEIVDIAFQIHWTLGPGLLESVYEKCFCYELGERNLEFKKQQKVPIVYKGILFEDALRLDLIVENSIIVEIKAQENFHPVWEAQLLSYLRLTHKELGFLINFTVPKIKDGISRKILSSRSFVS